MNISKDFADFIELLNNHSVEYMIVGGYAVGLHGLPRYTGDLDIWVNNSNENLDRLKKVIFDFGGPLSEIDFNKLQLKPTKSNPVPGIGFGREPLRIEILSSLAGVDFSDCYKHTESKKIGSLMIKYINYDDLKTSKLNSERLKDKGDIEELEKIRKFKKE